MTDVTKLLNQDHREVEKLFERFKESEDRAVLDRICQQLELHTSLEEEIVYPELAGVDADLEREADDEHDQARRLIARIREAGDGDLVRLAAELEEAVNHHVEEEESEAWPKLREALDPRQLEEMGRTLETRKEEATAGMQGSGDGTSAVSGRSRKEQLVDLTREELYEQAKKADVKGRSSMTKDELVEALSSSAR